MRIKPVPFSFPQQISKEIAFNRWSFFNYVSCITVFLLLYHIAKICTFHLDSLCHRLFLDGFNMTVSHDIGAFVMHQGSFCFYKCVCMCFFVFYFSWDGWGRVQICIYESSIRWSLHLSSRWYRADMLCFITYQ